MPLQAGELTFLQNLAPRFNIPVPEFLVEPVRNATLQQKLEAWGAGIVKPDVLRGQRGKANALERVSDPREAVSAMKRVAATQIRGLQSRTAYIVQEVPADLELFTAITYSAKTLSPAFTLSTRGGMDIEDVDRRHIATVPVNVFQGLDAYQASQALSRLGIVNKLNSRLSLCFVNQWDMFIATGMRSCEINPWRVTRDGKIHACDFKATFDEQNFRTRDLAFLLPEYPVAETPFEAEMNAWAASSHQGQAHVSDLGGAGILPILFGGGASTIITETLSLCGGDPIFLSDFGGNPPYERMKTADRRHLLRHRRRAGGIRRRERAGQHPRGHRARRAAPGTGHPGHPQDAGTPGHALRDLRSRHPHHAGRGLRGPPGKRPDGQEGRQTMRARALRDLLRKDDRVAVSNITGREASKVTAISQAYCGNVVAGWALGKEGQRLDVPGGKPIRVYGQFADLMRALPRAKRPNKIVVYSPPEAVYGDVKETLDHGKSAVETIFVITENVSIEVTAKLRRLCDLAGVDIIGCNTLGMINAHDGVRVGAVGGDAPGESFRPGSTAILSNSGNMVNTIAAYLRSVGLGVSFGISTGKDALILTPPAALLKMAHADRRTRLAILYVEPGGTYEQDVVELLRSRKTPLPVVVYVAGAALEGRDIALGHAGAVAEGPMTSATAKMKIFDDYFRVGPFRRYKKAALRGRLARTRKGIRVMTLHDIPEAAATLLSALKMKPDFEPEAPLDLNPWVADMGKLSSRVPRDLVMQPGAIPEPHLSVMQKLETSAIGGSPARQSMRSASHASSSDGAVPRLYGHSLLEQMKTASFAGSVLLGWLGEPPRQPFETRLFDMCLQASLTNGPGTISAQGAKLSASAGNEPNTAMIATLGTLGIVHGGNGKRAARMLIDIFRGTGLANPYARRGGPDLDGLVSDFVSAFLRQKATAKELGVDYERVPCLGHPVFNREAVNYDPRERVVSTYLETNGLYNIFLDFYHRLSRAMCDRGATNKVHAVNLDAVIASVCMGISWPLLVEKRISMQRALDLPFLTFALGRTAGGAAEYLDHRDTGTPMDMRVPVRECRAFSRPKD
jgi:succinyl-CoA synthetase beta subunit/succinyl-CoA synthetase alpha subunit/citrate synthase